MYGSADVRAPYHFDNNSAPLQLAWPNDLAGAIAFRRRLTRAPEHDPFQDNTIAFVKANRENYIRLMIHATYSMDASMDSPDSAGARLLAIGGPRMVSPREVEAMCRLLFQAIIDCCEEGRCGYPGADPLSEKRRTGRKDGCSPWKLDLSYDCKVRIESAIFCMREWKSICKDMLESDSEIVNFANAPDSTAVSKKTFERTNGTRDSNSQNERAESIAAAYGSECVEELRTKDKKGKLPPLAQVQRKMSKQHKASSIATNESPAADQTTRQSQPHTQHSASPFRESFSSDLDKLFTLQDLDEFNVFSQTSFGNMQPYFGDSKSAQEPPAYDVPDFSGFSQQGQSYAPQRHHAALSRQPMHNSNSFEAAQQAPQTFGGYGQGIVPVNYTSYGPISVYAPYSLNNWGDPYGDHASPISNNNYGNTQRNQALPEPQGIGTGIGTLRASGTISAAPRPSRFNSEARTFKHGRTATMDAQFQPPPGRVKGDQTQYGAAPRLDQVDEE